MFTRFPLGLLHAYNSMWNWFLYIENLMWHRRLQNCYVMHTFLTWLGFACFDPDLRQISIVRNILFRRRQDDGCRLTLVVDPTSTAVFETNFLEPKIVGVSGHFDALGEGNWWLQRKHSTLGGRWQPLREFIIPEHESWWRILLVWWSYDGLLGTSAVISEG